VSPAATREISETQIHNPHALKAAHVVTDCLGHASNLPIATLDEDHPDGIHGKALNAAGQRGTTVVTNIDAPGQLHDVILADGLAHRDGVFALVAVLRQQQSLNDVALVRQQDQPLAHHVEAADVDDALWELHRVDDVVRHRLV